MNSIHRYCHNCGKPVQLDYKFCPFCQTSLASLDSKPPAIDAPRQQNTFTPIAVGEDDDDDNETLRADKARSLSDLGISISSLDIDLGIPDRPEKQSIANVIAQGAQLPQGYKESPRPVGSPVSSQDFIEQMRKEAGTLRPK